MNGLLLGLGIVMVLVGLIALAWVKLDLPVRGRR